MSINPFLRNSFRLVSLVLACLLFFSSCKEEKLSDMEPEVKNADIQNLVERWTTETNSMAEIEKTIAEYKALDSKKFDLFIKAKAKYKIEVLGEYKPAWELQEQAELEMNKRAVAKYGKGYNQLASQELLELENQVYNLAPYDAVTALFASAPAPSVSASNKGKVQFDVCSVREYSTICNFQGATITYPFADDEAYATTSLAVGSRCADRWANVRKTGQWDCEYMLVYWGLRLSKGAVPDAGWRSIWGSTAEVQNGLAGMGGIGVHVNGYVTYSDHSSVDKALLLGKVRTNGMGGIQNVANRTKLNP